jgi:hypothetical protein
MPAPQRRTDVRLQDRMMPGNSRLIDYGELKVRTGRVKAFTETDPGIRLELRRTHSARVHACAAGRFPAH